MRAPRSTTADRLAAVLWDMDGTLVDTEPYWIATEFAMAERHGGTWSTEHALNLVGKALLHSGVYIREHMGIDLTPEEIVEELLDGVVALVRQEVPWRPGARELLTEIRAAALPTALVTTTPRRLADLVLAQLARDLDVPPFDLTVCGDEVPARKPDPAPYHQAMAALGVDADGCVAVEDSLSGATAGLAAGAAVLGVPSLQPLPALPGLVLRDTLAGVRPADLAEVLAARDAAHAGA